MDKKGNQTKLIFSWINHAKLKKQVEDAGKRYFDEAEKIQGADRDAKKIIAIMNFRQKGEMNNADLRSYIEAYSDLNNLKRECVIKHNLDISLVALASLPNYAKFDVERKKRQDDLEKSIIAAKKEGVYFEQ